MTFARCALPLLLAACVQDASLNAVKEQSGGPVEGAQGAPAVEVSPELVDLGIVPSGTSGAASVWVESTGTDSLDVQDISIAGEGWSFSVTALPSEVEPGSSLVVSVRFTASGDGASYGALAVETNAGARAVALVANAPVPDTGSSDTAADTGEGIDDDTASPDDTADSGDTGATAPCTLGSVAHLPAAGSSQVAVDVDHREIIAPAYDMGSYAEIFDADTFASVTTFATGARGNPVLVDLVGNQVWVGNPDSGSVTVVERGTHNAVTTLTGFQNPHSIVQDPDTGTIYVADHFAGTVTAFDPLTFDDLGSVTLGYGLTQMSIGDGTLYVPRTDGTLDVLDAATLSVLDSVMLASSLYGAAIVPGSDRLFAAGFGAGLVYVMEASTLTTLGTVAIANPYQLKVSADATEVAVPAYGDGTLSLLDSATGTVLATAAACTGATDASEDTTTGRWVVTCATRSGLEVLECR